ncbi:hypothetical protein EG327_000197 [Venturia inaequalis]|uniref:Uncharacterized protein n=1 Tax=Venturia inaequalis TaxID=5025 RepID=A0A8H3UAR1_VENIN|nr:hypothetical protein EG327_000197 [Venturia inaequalis]
MFAESDRYIYNNGTLEALVGKFYFRAKIQPTRKIIDYVQLFNGIYAIPTTPSFFKEARATCYAIDAYEFNLDEGEDFLFITTRLLITLLPVVVRSVTGTGYNSKIEKVKRKALREGGGIAPTEVEDLADEDEETDNKSKDSDEEPIIDKEEDSYEDVAPEIISSKEKKELLTTKKAYEVEGLKLTLYE